MSGYMLTLRPTNQYPFRTVEFFFNSDKVPYMVSFQGKQENPLEANYPNFYRVDATYSIDSIINRVFEKSAEGGGTPMVVTRPERMLNYVEKTPWYPIPEAEPTHNYKVILEVYDKDPSSLSDYSGAISIDSSSKLLELQSQLSFLESLPKSVPLRQDLINYLSRYHKDAMVRSTPIQIMSDPKDFNEVVFNKKFLTKTTLPGTLKVKFQNNYWLEVGNCRGTSGREEKNCDVFMNGSYTENVYYDTSQAIQPEWNPNEVQYTLQQIVSGHRKYNFSAIVDASTKTYYTLTIYMPADSPTLSRSQRRILSEAGLLL